MKKNVKTVFDFLDQGKSPFHSVAAAKALLDKAGYRELSEAEAWHLKKGGKYYTTRNESSIIAWRMPKKELKGWRGTLSHSDSPTFRITSTKTADPRFGHARVEEYGGPRYSTWQDRPLTFAGRILVQTANGIESRLVAPEKPLLVIPTLCCHFDREGRKGGEIKIFPDMQPIFGEAGTDLMDLLQKDLKKGEKILSCDLCLALPEKATLVGIDDAFFMAPRIDDLGSAVCTLLGFLSEAPSNSSTPTNNAAENFADLWCMFDNEEVGSSSRQGALGSFLPDVMSRMEEALGVNADGRVMARASGLFLSVDNGHAVHPNHPETSDSEHPVCLNKGVVIKYNASQKYTTNGFSAALFQSVCEKAKVPYQVFYNRPDIAGGGTLGNLLSHQVSVPMADIGMPQLSMHSACETAGTKDIDYMIDAVKAFYEMDFRLPANGR